MRKTQLANFLFNIYFFIEIPYGEFSICLKDKSIQHSLDLITSCLLNLDDCMNKGILVDSK